MENKKKILIVEDETSLLNALAEKFIHEGFSPLKVKNGEEGLEVALREHPDLILLDLLLPKLDGMTMMDRLRGDEWGKKVPIIIFTNLDADDQRLKRVIADQPSYYLIKTNTSLEDVIEKTKEILESKKEEV